MTIEQLGSTGEFIAALATLATLVYLAVQIRQNTASVRSASAQQILQGIAEFNQFLSSDPSLVGLWLRGLGDPDALSEQEWLRFLAVASSFVLRMELMFINHREGLLPVQIWEAQVNSMRHMFAMPAMQRWFSEFGSMVHVDFRQFVEELTPANGPAASNGASVPSHK